MPELNPMELPLSEHDLKMTAMNEKLEAEEALEEAGSENYEPDYEKQVGLADRLQTFFKEIKPEQLKKLFDRENDHSCSCIDERVLKGAVRLPGAGILMGDPEKVAKMLLKENVKEILSHEGCGAAALATKKIAESDPSVPKPAWYREDDVDGNAERFAEAVAEAMNRLRGETSSDEEKVTASHLTFYNGGMEGNQERHVASVIYYDVTRGGFNRHALQELNLPLGFVVSERAGSDEESNLILATDIAFGHHGATHGFNQEKPLAIMILAQNEKDLKSKVNETQAMISRHLPDHVNEIVVDGVIAPLEPKKN